MTSRKHPKVRCQLAGALLLACMGVSADCWAKDPAVQVVGRDGKSLTLSAADLKALPRTELEGREHDGSTAKFAGVEVSQLLAKVGAAQGENLRGEWLRCVVLIDAADGYRAVFALPEFDAAFTDRKIVLADTRNGAGLPENSGPFQIIVPDEKRHARWVRMVTRIRIVDSREISAADK